MFLRSDGPDDNSDRDLTTAANSSEPRGYKWRYGPLRLTAPWIAIAAGLIAIVKSVGGLGGVQKDATTVFLFGGIGLIVLGIASFFVYRWMAKRGI
jgi:hypothetical protein